MSLFNQAINRCVFIESKVSCIAAGNPVADLFIQMIEMSEQAIKTDRKEFSCVFLRLHSTLSIILWTRGGGGGGGGGRDKAEIQFRFFNGVGAWHKPANGGKSLFYLSYQVRQQCLGSYCKILNFKNEEFFAACLWGRSNCFLGQILVFSCFEGCVFW